jgi:hypothetical protein
VTIDELVTAVNFGLNDCPKGGPAGFSCSAAALRLVTGLLVRR